MSFSNKPHSQKFAEAEKRNSFRPFLVAVREASFSFQSKYLFRSKEFKNLIQFRAEMTDSLKILSAEIVELLFVLIKNTVSEKEQKKLVDLKRNIYNLRSIPVSRYTEFEKSEILIEKLKKYNEFQHEIAGIVDSYSIKIEDETERICNQLLQDNSFQAALDYSSPTFSFSKADSKIKLSKWLKRFSTVYVYAVKHVTKTAPLFTFSRIYLAESIRKVNSNTFETILNTELFSEVERSVIKAQSDDSLVKLELVTNWRSLDNCCFLIFRNNIVRVLMYKKTLLLVKILSVFRESELAGQPVTYKKLRETVSPENSEEDSNFIDKLQTDGIIFPYIIENVEFPTKYLSDFDSEKQEIYAELRKTNGQIIRNEEIGGQHKKITKLISTFDAKINPPYIGYSYAEEITDNQKILADVFINELSIIRNIFRLDNNNSYNKATIIGLIEKCFESSGKTRLSFLELLTRVMWLKIDEQNIKDSYDTDTSQQINLISAEILKMTGNLTNNDILKLIEFLPENSEKKSSENAYLPICLVGAVDFQTPRFYVHNIFSGNSRFLTKYRVEKTDISAHFNIYYENIVNVEVMPGWNIPQHRVPGSFNTGFSFDKRSSQLFRETVQPEDIEVVFDKIPIFLHRITKKELKFHYRGLALFQRLPIPYKLLLFDQIDFYINIFAQTPPKCERNQIVTLERLDFKSVNLRRSCICIGIELIKSCLAEKSWIRGAIQFQDYLKANFQLKSDYLYFRLIENNTFTDSPRFLDLLQPLSWDVFRRSVLKYPNIDSVQFTECSPLPEQMFQKEDGNYFTEFMIEV
jgi:hypothetical protein